MKLLKMVFWNLVASAPVLVGYATIYVLIDRLVARHLTGSLYSVWLAVWFAACVGYMCYGQLYAEKRARELNYPKRQ
jgi:hypothetical protein